MNIAESDFPLRVIHGIDTDNNKSGVYIVHRERQYGNMFSSAMTQVIAEREASLMAFILQGRKLKQFSGGELSDLFEPED